MFENMAKVIDYLVRLGNNLVQQRASVPVVEHIPRRDAVQFAYAGLIQDSAVSPVRWRPSARLRTLFQSIGASSAARSGCSQ